MSQLVLDGMPEPLYPATPARIATYDDCPRRYRLAYLDRPAPPKGPPSAHQSIGATVHVALARWWGLPRSRRTPREGGALLVDGWVSVGFRDDSQSRAARRRSRDQVERYLGDVDPDAVPLGVERTVSVTSGAVSLWGRADRIDDRGELGAVVVDYKTGRSVPTEADAAGSLALAVYAAGTAETLRTTCTRVELHHLPSGVVAAWDHDAESLGGHLGHAETVGGELARLDATAPGLSPARADEAFPARVAPRCGWCEVRSVCGPGRAVPQRRSWEGLPAGE